MKRRLYLPFLTLLLLVSAMSCGDETKAPPPGDGTTSPTAFLRTETPVPSPPFTLSQPLDASVVLTEEHLTGAAYFVLDVDSGLMQVLVPDLSDARVGAQGGRAGIFPEWSDNDTLLVRNIDGTTYLARLDGTIAASGHVPQPADLKGAPSTDGKWFASVQVSGQLSVVVSTAPGGAEPRFRITSATLPLWSPALPSTLALLTNVCSGPDLNGGFDLALFDPVAGELRAVSDDPYQIIPTFEWRPDGSAIAADLVFTGNSETEPRAEIALIDVRDGSSRTLAAIPAGGELVPVGWSPDGEKLLFGYNGGRGLCDSDGTAELPTELEVIGE